MFACVVYRGFEPGTCILLAIRDLKPIFVCQVEKYLRLIKVSSHRCNRRTFRAVVSQPLGG